MFEWLVGVMAAGGVLGVAFLMFAENIVPPIPAEVVMPLAGFAAAQGHFSLAAVVVAGSAGALLGAVAWYAVGRALPEARLERWIEAHGRWLTLCVEDLDRARRFVGDRGGWPVGVGRLIPGVRTFISVPAGFLRMPLRTFLFWSALGTTVWTALLATAGYLLASQFGKVEAWLDPITHAVLALTVGAYLWRLWRQARRRSQRCR